MKIAPEAIATLYEQHAEPLLRLATLLVGRDGAEDLVQDAFVQALDHWKPDAPTEAFRAWAKTTMVRASISRWRRSVRETQAFERHGVSPAATPADPLPEMRAALADLSPRQRAATVLRYFEDLTPDEIAERMSIRASTVRALLYQSREKLRMDARLVETG